MAASPIVAAADATGSSGTVAERLAHFMRPGALALPALPPLSLYVHVPWCLKKCPYCDFNSHAWRGGEPLPETRYVDALVRDLEDALPFVWVAASIRSSSAGARRASSRRRRSSGSSPRSARVCRSSPAARSRSRRTRGRSSASASTAMPTPA